MIKPIKRVQVSEKDRQQLRGQANNRKRQETQPADYQGKVVIKPWGHEFLIFENEWVAIWFLHIRKDHATSMHCHPAKKTSLTLLCGKALCNTFRSRNFLNPADAMILDAAVFHSTKALSLQGISLIEVETPPRKLDLVRLEDNYGRENCGYEGCAQMITENLEGFSHFFFQEQDFARQRFGIGDLFHIDMIAYDNSQDFRRRFAAENGTLYCVVRGAIFDSHGHRLIDVGEIERGGYLQQFETLDIQSRTTLLRFKIYT